MKQTLSGIGLLVFLAVLAGCESNAVRTAGSIDVVDENMRVHLQFSSRDIELIRGYYSPKKRKGMPPGLAKKDRLPPGLEKQLVRNATLPPGLNGRSLPDPLERQLQRLPDGYVRIIIGARILLINSDTRAILDVITDVVI